MLLDLLVARSTIVATASSPQLDRGREIERHIRAGSDRIVVVQQVFYEALDKLLERFRLLAQLNGGYILGPRWQDWPVTDQNTHLAGWSGADGVAARQILEGIQTDADLQVELFPSAVATTDWFDSQRVFYQAHQFQGPRFHTSDLVILCQAIIARADRIVTRDGAFRKGIEALRQDAAFQQALTAIGPDLRVPSISTKVRP